MLNDAQIEVLRQEVLALVDPAQAGRYTIDFVENGRRVESIAGMTARRTIPAAGYVRAVVTRDDGKRAWIQPARRP